MWSPIPFDGSVEFRVCAFGHLPGNMGVIVTYVNGSGPYEFTRSSHEFWKFENHTLSSDEQKMLTAIWVGELNRFEGGKNVTPMIRTDFKINFKREGRSNEDHK